MSEFVLDLIKKYRQGPTEIALSNMQKIDKGFNTDNVFALAYLATNEAIPEADREVFKQLVHLKIEANRSQSTFKKLEENPPLSESPDEPLDKEEK
jgi:galactokinase